jgi:hypothetical protein
MPVDIGAATTRKLGPLPVWGWAIVIGGGVLLLRLFRGGSSDGGGQDVTYVPVGNPGTGSFGGGTDGIGTPGEPGAPGAPGEPGASADITGLLPFNVFETYNTLLVKLTGLLAQRDSISNRIQEAQVAIARDTARFKDGFTTKATYDANIATWTSRLTAAQTEQSAVDTQIKDTQALLNTTAVGSGT